MTVFTGEDPAAPEPITDEGIVVCSSGGRDYNDKVMVYAVLGKLHRERTIAMLIEGGCPVGKGGSDELSRLWAKDNEVNCLSIPPKSKKLGWPKCGPIRNAEMGKCNPDVWVLFPGGRGTASARECAVACGAEIIEVSYDD